MQTVARMRILRSSFHDLSSFNPDLRLMQTSKSFSSHCLCMDNVNPSIKNMGNVVRGPLLLRAAAIAEELKQGVKKPFNEVVFASIGDCHAMGQIPITFIRQVLALCIYEALFDDFSIPSDAKERARTILNGCQGSLGSYSDSAGIQIIRQHCAEFIARRDRIPSDWQDIILSSGASGIIKAIFSLICNPVGGKRSGVMIPIPQYPLYSATISELDMAQIEYFLDESRNWSLDISELQRSIDEAKKTLAVRAIVIINPGNPTGQVLPRQNIEEIIEFAFKEKLLILADEVYQDNVYAKESKFYSFKQVLSEMGNPYNQMEMASFMSCSKGYMGECGIRAGYAEVINMCPDVKALLLKSISAQLCPSTVGQACIDVVANPPRKGEPSYDLFMKEKNEILASLKTRAEIVVHAFNKMEGTSCTPVQGAMYAFPQIKLPKNAIEAAKFAGHTPDSFYALQLLESTGICVVPGSAFGQRPGTFHYRTTILPCSKKLNEMLELLRNFHIQFHAKYK